MRVKQPLHTQALENHLQAFRKGEAGWMRRVVLSNWLGVPGYLVRSVWTKILSLCLLGTDGHDPVMPSGLGPESYVLLLLARRPDSGEEDRKASLGRPGVPGPLLANLSKSLPGPLASLSFLLYIMGEQTGLEFPDSGNFTCL